MRYLQLTVILLATACLTGCYPGHDRAERHKAKFPEKELRELSNTMAHAETYQAEKRDSLHSLTDSLNSSLTDSKRWEYAVRLSTAYRSFNTDSAFKYAYKAIELAEGLDTSFREEALISEVDAFSTAGLFNEACYVFMKMDPSRLSLMGKLRYWLAGRRLYGYMRGYARDFQEVEQRYNRMYMQYDDSLLLHLPHEGHLWQFINGERLVNLGHYKEAEAQLKSLMDQNPNINLYAMAAFQLAQVYKNYGREEQYAAMLAISATADIKGGIREGDALPNLAQWLYEQGEMHEAFSFINFALEEAASSNARMRAVTIVRFLPAIDEAYRAEIERRNNLNIIFLVIAVVLLGSTGMLTIFLYQQNKRSLQNEKRLARFAEMQKSYMGNFIGLYSSYADRLNRLTKLVSLKLASGQTAELKKLIDSGKYEDRENDDVHHKFDSAFLDIYPEYIDDINELLRDEEKIVLKDKDTLTPELRIYAFVVLGVDESLRISQILHYSPNTVYAYRNKMRNRAINRETFDEDVKALGKTERITS